MVNFTRIIQKISAMLVIACLFATSSQAHESRPARAKLFVEQQNLLNLEITLDLERFLTSTQVQTRDSHDITFETAYREFQSLTPDALSQQIAKVVASGILPFKLISESDSPIELTLAFADIPALPSANKRRDSTLHFIAPILAKENAVRLYVPARGTALIASVGTDDNAASDDASQPVYLLPGETSLPMVIKRAML